MSMFTCKYQHLTCRSLLALSTFDIRGLFARPHCVLRDCKTLRATLAPAACFFTDIWRNHEVHLGMNHDVPIAWIMYLMWQLFKRFRSFLSASYHDGSMAKQETIAYHTMVLVCFFLARSAFKIHTWHHFLHATWNKSRSRNLPSTAYFQSGPRVGTLELFSFVPFGQSTQLLREKRTTKQALDWVVE